MRRGPYSKNIQFNILFLSWLASREYVITDGNPRHPIHYFRQLALDLKLIVGQTNLQLRPATCADSLATTTNKLALVHHSQFMSWAC